MTAMGPSPKSLEGGLGHGEELPPDAAHVFWDKEAKDSREKSQYTLSPRNHSQDMPTDTPRSSVRSPFLVGFILVAFIFTIPHTIPVISTWLKCLLGVWSKILGSHRGWHDLSFVDTLIKSKDPADDPRALHKIPQYVLDYAPLVHLYSEEKFWPCDIKEHLFHVTPELNYTPIPGLPQLNLTNLDLLNQFEKGRNVFLTSNDNVEERPDWLSGEINIPDDYTNDAKANPTKSQSTRAHIRKQSHGGHSDAPAVLVTVDKGDGIVDAFWFFFYSYNLGNLVFNIRFGNHIGDWEHTLIRFEHGVPKVVFVSEHFFGTAYSFSAIEKIRNRVSVP